MPPLSSQTQESLPPAHSDSAHNTWDAWVSDRLAYEKAVMPAALKASGLSAPIPGLVELYDDGNFLDCGDYGTCWEPKNPQADAEVAGARQSPASLAQSPAQNPANPGFQPQLVSWQELRNGWCGQPYPSLVSRLARTPEELNGLLRQKFLQEQTLQNGAYSSDYSPDCYSGRWLFRRGRYVKVIKPHLPRCASGSCHPKHRPYPVWVRVGKQVGFVPRHPDDAKGKLPLNLKNGLLAPPSKQGELPRLLTVDSSEKVSVLNAAPKEFSIATPGLAVTPPEINAHLLFAGPRQNSAATANHDLSTVAYNYKSRSFELPASSGSHYKPVAVGGISSRGTLGSFASGSSARYASAFGHSTLASSYGGGYSRPSGGDYGGGSWGGGGHGSGGSSPASSGGPTGHFSSGGGGGTVSNGGGAVSGGGGGSASSGGGGGGGSHH